jgi:hypothetical protein
LSLPISDFCTEETKYSPENKRIILGLVPALFEPEEEMLSLGDIKVTRVLLNIGIAESRFDDS